MTSIVLTNPLIEFQRNGQDYFFHYHAKLDRTIKSFRSMFQSMDPLNPLVCSSEAAIGNFYMVARKLWTYYNISLQEGCKLSDEVFSAIVKINTLYTSYFKSQIQTIVGQPNIPMQLMCLANVIGQIQFSGTAVKSLMDAIGVIEDSINAIGVIEDSINNKHSF